ncbi:hypothetical protein SAMN04487969_105143 [Paenibacillus algorifonticola]|uniref:Uncharacterized protein n=1 Tax=Paenibacillus algorifonticola TaxID=684063 RepID=A0A1I2CLA8_9BACL|nr:hypothetical protein [Paenibacillus algorifonticola]SFE69117.1 hypothetical protein SAMN04487969_105143 [Paenibacillus algorifonticola]
MQTQYNNEMLDLPELAIIIDSSSWQKHDKESKKSIFNNADALLKMPDFMVDSGNARSFVAAATCLALIRGQSHLTLQG